MSAYEFEYELAKSDGVVFHFLTAPKRNSWFNARRSNRMRSDEAWHPDTTGKRIPDAIPNSEFQLPVDMIITAVGQDKPKEVFLSQIPKP